MTDEQARIMAATFAAELFGNGQAGQPHGHLRLLVIATERMVAVVEQAAKRVGK